MHRNVFLNGPILAFLTSEIRSKAVNCPRILRSVMNSMAESGMQTSWVISFGPFRVTRARRLVERNDEAIRLGSRAFDVLVYLLEHAGQVVSHRALLEAVWPGTYVAEGNLRFQMAVLRKALGSGEASYIINVPGRGYCFTAPLSKRDEVEYHLPLLNNVIIQPGSLAIPPANEDATNILPYPVSPPFMENAPGTVSAASPDKEGKFVADICAKLDDLTLAIELMASQVKVSGTDKLSDMLEERWLPSGPGRGLAPSRNQTLYAMLDWSYGLLSEKEKRVFRYISVFAGQFDLEAAIAVVDEDVETASLLVEFASRSLLSLNQSRLGTRYRLFDTTKSYARDRLAAANEVRDARHRHAIFFVQVLQNLKDGHFNQSLSTILTSEIDDVLAAVVRGFTSEHDSIPCRRILEEAKKFGRSMATACIG
jgi:DNA-binding winged helix-turn-helix (wHTH) protein